MHAHALHIHAVLPAVRRTMECTRCTACLISIVQLAIWRVNERLQPTLVTALEEQAGAIGQCAWSGSSSSNSGTGGGGGGGGCNGRITDRQGLGAAAGAASLLVFYAVCGADKSAAVIKCAGDGGRSCPVQVGRFLRQMCCAVC